MAKIISQETFDDVVKENIIEFSMDVAEAQNETVEQFQAQGINLANIIVDLKINEETGRPVMNETIEQLKAFARTDTNDDALVQLLDVVTNECKTSVPHRVVSALFEESHKNALFWLEETCKESKKEFEVTL